ncbi:MAG: hypothetical protein LBV19_06475 [Streptococcaceae bacterium]|jgi:predicted RNA-binding Zn-ribbon protein involved in translation (DUF1610 family)|nr:hypothetical protein [Streptococcaceae bacterium]
MIPGEIIGEVVYDKGAPNGLSSVWNSSLHLVTNDKHYPTEDGNLNFVFADNEIWTDYWKLYYDKMPSIMNFIVEVFVKCFERIVKPSERVVWFNRFLRDMKMANAVCKPFDIKILNNVLEHVTTTCESCGEKIEFDDDTIAEFYNDFIFTCPNCGNKALVGDYLYDKSGIDSEKINH